MYILAKIKAKIPPPHDCESDLCSAPVNWPKRFAI